MLYGAIEVGEVVQWSAGVDWLTVTNMDDSREGCARFWRNLALQVVHDTADGSLRPEYATVEGYKGHRCGRTFVGTLPGQGCMMIATGEASNALASIELGQDNTSRMDIQLTIWTKTDRQCVIEEAAKKSKAATLGAQGRPWGVELRETYGNGNTAYLGSRSSDVFCRIYDKGRESHERFYNQALRYEAVLKREWAGRGHTHILGGYGARADVYAATAKVFRSRGVAVPAVVPMECNLVKHLDLAEDRIDRKMKWFREQVRPSVVELLTEGVSRDTILKELGL